jgi:hypothetical protein
MHRTWLVAAVAGVVLPAIARADEPAPVGPPTPATQPATQEDVAALRAELDEQRSHIDAQQAEIERLKANSRPLAPPLVPPPAPAPAALTPPLLRVSGYVQVDWVIHDQTSQDEIDYSTGLPINQDRFTLRRGHVRLDAQRGPLAAVLEIDANTVNGLQVRPIDAEVLFRWPPPSETDRPVIVASMGLMKIPFGFEVPELDNVRPFLERSTVMRALFPGEFDLGARLGGGYRAFDWAIAVMNGNPIGDKEFPALAPGKTKELVGRIGAHVEPLPGVRFDAGISGDTGLGFHEGTPTTKDVLVWHDDNGDGIVQATEIGVIPGSSATPSQQFQRFAVGADARLAIRVPLLGDLAIRAEVVRGKNLDRGIEYADPIGAGHDLREVGWYAGVTQELTRWGVVGVRYDQYDPDEDASEQSAANVVPVDRTYRTLALMGMLRYESGRLVLEYDHNGNALGRDANGSPTTLRDDVLTLRGQVTF